MKNKEEILKKIKEKEDRIVAINDMNEVCLGDSNCDGVSRLCLLEIAFAKKEIEILTWILDETE